jgi:hypothetical protein
LTQRQIQTQGFWCFTGLLVAILIAYYWNYLTGRASFYVYDLHAGWWPTFTYLGERLRSGQLPLWNPYSVNGVAQIDVIAPTVFYPLNLIFAVLPFNSAFALLLIAQQLIAGCAMFALVISFGWGVRAAALAGATIALCGFVFSLQPTPTLLGTIAWFIAAYWSQRSIALAQPGRKLFHTAASAVFTYLMIVAGVAEVFVPGLVFLGAAAVFEAASQAGSRGGQLRCRAPLSVRSSVRARRPRSRLALWIMCLRLVALATGVLMSACAVLPAIEWARLSSRAVGLPLDEIFAWSCNWYDLFCVWSVQSLGDLYIPQNPFRPLVATAANQTPYLENAFIGPIILTAALWAAFDRTFKYRFVAAGVFVASIILSVGWHFAPTLMLVKALHLQMVRYPIKALALTAISSAILAARGMYLFVAKKGSAGNAVAWVIWSTAVVAGAVMQFLGKHPSFIQSWHVSKLWLEVLSRCGSTVLFSGAIGLVCACLWSARLKGDRWLRNSSVILLAAAIGLYCFDAWQFNRHEGPGDLYTRPSLVADKVRELSTADGALRTCAIVYTNPLTPPIAMPRGRPHILSIYGYAVNLMVPHTNVCHHIRNVSDFTVGQTADHDALWKSAMSEYFKHQNSVPLGVMCQMFAAKLMGSQLGHNVMPDDGLVDPYAIPDQRYFYPAWFDTRLNIGLFAVRDPLPRAYFAPAVRWMPEHKQVMEQLLRPDKSGFDPHKIVFLESEQTKSAPDPDPDPAISADQVRQSTVQFNTDDPEHVGLTVSTPVANYLILDDQFYPGWHAYLDGSEVPIARANAVFRAVLVPAGKHAVTFTDEPLPLVWGLLLHALAWLILIKLIVLSLIVRKAASATV